MASAFPNSGRQFIATALKDKATGIYVAMGNGSVAWDATPVDPDVYVTSLTAEHGRRKASQVQYATPDAGGTINTDLGVFSTTGTPTNYLYILGQFDFSDAVGQTIREVGVFGGVVLNGGVSDTGYILPAQISQAGTLLSVSRFVSFVRSNTVRQNFEFIIEL